MNPVNNHFTLFQKIKAYIKLMRLDKPVGIELLLWPTLCAVYIAGYGQPDVYIIILFIVGSILMRSAGCVINDYADRDFDGQVERTQYRPLATGIIQPKQALGLFAMLVGLSAGLLLFLPQAVFWWSWGALGLATLYPFMKRFTYLPQFFLGAAFSWAIPMAYVAQGQTPGLGCWLFYAANLCWTVAYDTQYAMTDRADDVKAGIKSTAILFGEYDRIVIAVFQVLFLGLLAFVLKLAMPNILIQHGIMIGVYFLILTSLFIWQFYITKNRERSLCFKAFLHNRWVGRFMFLGLAGLYYWA